MLTSQLEIIAQAQSYLKTVSTSDYTEVLRPNFISSAGAHIRHIIDHYLALIAGVENNLVDYELRIRAQALEASPTMAEQQFQQISCWLTQLNTQDLNRAISVSTEISISTKQVQVVQSSLARELVFVGSHAVHHFAMIAQISLAQNTILPAHFGVAPATTKYLGAQQQADVE